MFGLGISLGFTRFLKHFPNFPKKADISLVYNKEIYCENFALTRSGAVKLQGTGSYSDRHYSDKHYSDKQYSDSSYSDMSLSMTEFYV